MFFDSLFDSPKPPKDMTYRYTDGNNNSYYISPQRVVYAPVSPIQSSSGIYDGGDPADVEIAAEVYEVIVRSFAQAQANKNIQMTTRPKGCGTLFFVANEEQIYIAMNSKEKSQLENILKAAIA